MLPERSTLLPDVDRAFSALKMQRSKKGVLFVEGLSDLDFLCYHLQLHTQLEIVACRGKTHAIDNYKSGKGSPEATKWWIGLMVDHDHDFLDDDRELIEDLSTGNVIVVDRPDDSTPPSAIDLESCLPLSKIEGIVGIKDLANKSALVIRLQRLAAVLHYLRNQRLGSEKRLRIAPAPSGPNDSLPNWISALDFNGDLPKWNLHSLFAMVSQGRTFDVFIDEINQIFQSLSSDGIPGLYKGHELVLIAYCCHLHEISRYQTTSPSQNISSVGFFRYQSDLLSSLDSQTVRTLAFVDRLNKSITSN
jgi:hypothetical protein